ncbi:uncharacterized protein LOC110336891 [Mus pahari]|uniref:uncharacterized protein LOC110336891 n=1 Tax=Mus pahari TaxID=10093 RepID=UPI000A312520|nr:uncharacterized protein LOC110336891 [Mus pahari]
MEVSSELPRKGCTSRQGLLFAASLLACWLLSTTAQVTIESVPFNVVEGENVLLLIDNLPENLIALAWYRGLRKIVVYTLNTKVSVMGQMHSGREIVSSNGSLWIHNVTRKDTGFYTLRTINRRGEIVSTSSMYLYVYSSLFICGHPSFPAKLTIESVPPSVAEGGSVLLLVHNLQDKLRGLSWYKGASVSRNLEVARQIIAKNSSVPGPAHSGRETMYSNGSLLLQNVTCNDTGFYTLRTLSRHRKMELAHVQLQVDTSLSPCCDTVDSAQLSIDPMPRHAAEGECILLRVLNLPEDFQFFCWYKGASTFQIFKIAEYSRARNSIIKGPAESRTERVFTNGSLLLQDVTEKDTGLYTLQTIDRNFKIEKAHVQIHVNKHVTQPFMRVTDSTVHVQSSVVFTCFSDNTGISIRWLFNNQSVQLTERMTLSPSKCQLRIHAVRKEDAGEYQCEVSNPVSSQTSLPVSLASKDMTVRRQMEVSSELPRKGCTSWQGLLFAASFLTCLLLPITAQVTIESVPPQVVEGENVLFIVRNLPENLVALAWFRRLKKMNHAIGLYALNTKISVMGPMHSGREIVSSNGSLWIQNVTQKDTGLYTLQTLNRRGEIVSRTPMYLYVYSSLLTCRHPPTSSQLNIESVPSSVAEGASVILLVHNLPENLRRLFWYKGVLVSNNLEVARHIIAKNSSVPGPAHSGRETVYSNGSLLLQNVTRNDTGFYTLRTLSRHRKMELAHVQLQVDTSLSSCCDPLTSAQLTIHPVPPHAAEGGRVLLQVYNLPEYLKIFSWYKRVSSIQVLKIADYIRATNSIIRGSAESRRETVYTNGSLLLQHVTEKDTGLYTLQTIDKNFKIETAPVQVHVSKPVTQPFMRVTDTIVRVQSSVVFTCFSDNTGISMRWLFNNQSLQLTERMTLSPSKCQLTIHTVRKEDAGEYQCEVSNPVSSKSSLPVSLAVMNE